MSFLCELIDCVLYWIFCIGREGVRNSSRQHVRLWRFVLRVDLFGTCGHWGQDWHFFSALSVVVCKECDSFFFMFSY